MSGFFKTRAMELSTNKVATWKRIILSVCENEWQNCCCVKLLYFSSAEMPYIKDESFVFIAFNVSRDHLIFFNDKFCGSVSVLVTSKKTHQGNLRNTSSLFSSCGFRTINKLLYYYGATHSRLHLSTLTIVCTCELPSQFTVGKTLQGC